MKKILTILLILTFATIGVFAEVASDGTGTADLLIKLDVVPEAPRFALATTAGVKTNIKDYVEANVGDVNTESAYITDALNQNLVDGTDAKVSFSILQTQRSRINAKYKLEVTATPLVLVMDSNNTAKYSVSNYSNAVSTEKFEATCGDITAKTLTNVTLSASNTTLTATYNGSYVDATKSSDEKTIGTFDVTYTGNKEAVLGKYESLVTLTVTIVQ